MEIEIQKTVLILPLLCSMVMSLVNYHEGNHDVRCGKRTFIMNISGMEPECAACPESMYMDEENHTYYSCKRCTSYSADHTVETTSPCTADRNTVIVKCNDGFYIEHRPNEYGCKPCPLFARASPDQQECCSNTQNTSTPASLHPTTQPTSVTESNKTDYVIGSVNVTSQHSSVSSGSQLPAGAIVGICLACCLFVSVAVFFLYKKFVKSQNDRIKSNGRSDSVPGYREVPSS